MKVVFFYFLLLTINFNSFAQQHVVIGEGDAEFYENGRFVCNKWNMHTTMKNAWTEARESAELECNSDVQFREKLEEFIKCGDFGASLYASVKGRFACVPVYDSCQITSPYCVNNCCD